MDGPSFDTITRRLAVTTSRRGGIAALVAGALGIAGIGTSEAVVPIPPGCGLTGRLCTSGDECCSLRCIAKRDGTMRCARTTSNRKRDKDHAKRHNDSGGDDSCLGAGQSCVSPEDCCSGTFCIQISQFSSICKYCGDYGDRCGSTAPCCTQDGLSCQTSGSDQLCFDS